MKDNFIEIRTFIVSSYPHFAQVLFDNKNTHTLFGASCMEETHFIFSNTSKGLNGRLLQIERGVMDTSDKILSFKNCEVKLIETLVVVDETESMVNCPTEIVNEIV